MNEIRISTSEELFGVFAKQEYSCYRGVSDSKYTLVPKIGRFPSFAPIRLEKQILNKFKDLAIPHIDKIPKDDWEWLALSQHHGLATRLLDWTHNPFVAAFFAVENISHSDGAIYFFKIGEAADNIYWEKDTDPFVVKKVGVFHPPHISTRITVQAGLFTIHPDPNQPFEHDKITKLVLPKNLKLNLKLLLDGMGIHRFSAFPDLDGLSRFLNFLHERLDDSLRGH